jgi:hypothetical protein
VKLTPVNKSYPLVSSESPRCEIYFPSDSVLNLANAVLEAKIKFNQRGNAPANGAAGLHTQSVYPPRYALASLIEELNVYINGVSVSSTKRYSYIHNWIKDWLNTFDVEMNDGLNEVKDPSVLYQKPNGGVMAGYVVPRRGFPISTHTGVVADDDINSRNEAIYHMNLGDSIGFFGEASSKILNTAILGEIKLEIVFTSQIASCILGAKVATATPIFGSDANIINHKLESLGAVVAGADDAASIVNLRTRANILYNYEKFTNGYTLGDTGIPTTGSFSAGYDNMLAAGGAAADGAAATINGDANLTFQVSDIILHIEALQFKTNDYYDIMNRLVESGAYKYHFKRYVLQTDASTTSRQIDYRLVVNSECLNYVLATFRPSGYDRLSNRLNSLISPTSSGHCGVIECTWKNQVDKGLPFTFNQSKFFCRNGQKIARLGWKVDEVYFEPRNKREMYIDNLRHWRNYVPGVETKPHAGLKNVYDFEHCYFTGILSFENKSEDDVKYVYPLRGLNTNGKAVAISCFTETEDNNFTGNTALNDAGRLQFQRQGISDIDLEPANGAIPTFLVCTTASLNLMGRRNIDIKF